ncbi:MAG: hypothetical protein KME55_17615 [Nostoc indistinguendum CM1-VF10]|jgi:hypothetical protein|nr:hypothetical protein [Nostoc indistinguendum CM1-VF10]
MPLRNHKPGSLKNFSASKIEAAIAIAFKELTDFQAEIKLIKRYLKNPLFLKMA